MIMNGVDIVYINEAKRALTRYHAEKFYQKNFTIRNAMENWLNKINSHAGNVRDKASLSTNNYSIDAEVTQYGKAGNVLKTYNFVGLWPVDLAPIDLDWGSNDTIEEYSVTFAYQWWETNTTT